MSIGAAIGSAIATKALDKIGSTALELFRQHRKGELDEKTLEARLKEAQVQAAKDIEVSWAKSYASTFASLMAAATESKVIVWSWAIALYWSLFMLAWHQFGIPWYVHLCGCSFPSSGDTVGYARDIIFLCLGGGAAGKGAQIAQRKG